jgi:hypothetical protein
VSEMQSKDDALDEAVGDDRRRPKRARSLDMHWVDEQGEYFLIRLPTMLPLPLPDSVHMKLSKLYCKLACKFIITNNTIARRRENCSVVILKILSK